MDASYLPRYEAHLETLTLAPGREGLNRILVAYSLEVPESDELPGAFKESSFRDVLRQGLKSLIDPTDVRISRVPGTGTASLYFADSSADICQELTARFPNSFVYCTAKPQSRRSRLARRSNCKTSLARVEQIYPSILRWATRGCAKLNTCERRVERSQEDSRR
jgi:hypothetical protein